mgnify:CR=1 FL=1
MIQKIKENKLKSICIGLSAFLFGFITVSLFNNMNNTYAIDTSPVCPVGWYLDTWSSSDTACCPKNPEYKYGGKAYGGSCSLAGSIGSNYETCPYGTKGTAGSCWIASVQPEAPACYVCGGSSQGVGSYVWGNYSQSSACTKTSLTYENCKAPTYSCWICDANSSGNREYKWATSAPSTSCSSGSWYKSSTITSSANCVAPTYSCWICDANSSGNREYKWATSAPSTSCSSGSWYKSSTITSAANCVAPTTTTYTATFYANGGTFSDGSTTWSKTIYSGARNYFSQMGIPTLTLSGCTADGWYMTNASGTVYRQYFDTGDATKFYAHWSCSSSGGETGGGETPTPTTYTVKYDANGGTGAPSNQTKKQGESLTISTVKPTKTGYTFTSWNTKKDGTGTKYDIGALYTVDAELTLYAQYKENTVTYTIKYDANGGENAPKEQTKTKGKELVLSTIVPTKEGYKFVNWNTKKDGTGTSYNAGAKYTTEASVILYAQYEKELNEEETKYTITFYTNDGTTEKSTKVVNKGDKVVKPEDPTREGYTFDGWYDKKENGKEYDFTKEVTSDISLYAYWSKIGDKTNEDVNKNSKTGDVLIFIAWTAGIGALTYSVYYFKSRKETI